jgi:ParB family protein of integrating conjugative element (PFGI_1 class)
MDNADDGSPPHRYSAATAGCLILDVDDVDLYENNPRLAPNSAYEDLKRQIRRDGRAPGRLIVTRRPGSERYVMAAGGNTRLAILKELKHEHPDDPRWQRVEVQFEPFVDEMRIAVNTLQENTCRGDLLFIEQARGFLHVMAVWAAERPGSKATISEFLRDYQLRYGNAPSRASFHRMQYAVETLLSVIPEALIHGRMTEWAVRALIEYRNRVESLWLAQRIGSAAEFEGFFLAHLSRQNGELASERAACAEEPEEAAALAALDLKIDLDRLSDALAHEASLVDHVAVDAATIRIWIDQIRKGTPVEVIAALHPADGSPPQPERLAALGLAPKPPRQPVPYDTPDMTERLRDEIARREATRLGRAARLAAAPEPAPAPGGDPGSGAGRRDQVFQLLSTPALRDTNRQIALRIAAGGRFSQLIIPFEHGVGYLVADTIGGHNEEPVPIERAARWWAVTYCSLVLDLPPPLLHRLPADSLMRHLLETDQRALIMRQMGSPELFGYYTAALTIPEWQDFQLLQTGSRQVILSLGGADFLWGEAVSPGYTAPLEVTRGGTGDGK